MGSLAHLQVSRRPLAREVKTLANDFMRVEVLEKGGFLACVEARSSFLDKIKRKQFADEKLSRIRDMVLRGEAKVAITDEEGVLRIKGRVCVPRVDDLIHTILTEAHSSRYSIHPGATKMYRDLRQNYWWSRMKCDIVGFVAQCLNFQQVKRSFKQKSRQKEYANRKVSDLDFLEGEKVLLKVSPMKGVMRFGKRGKISPTYICPFEVLKRVEDVAYEWALPQGFSGVHPVFHVSMLKKYHRDGNYIIRWDSILLYENLSYKEEPIAILDREVRKLISKEVASIKV
ncbi:uncharacterized protein [Solanum lycopersicum]|uniref:uncharacterized protein n=1 Tax=Solanum lycopersicum TaxID=4081 RepID=UPI003747F949